MEIIDKELQVKIVNIRSDIEKQKDLVAGLRDHGDFLMALSPPAWVAEVRQERRKQLELFKRQWIREHKEDTRDDHILFRGDDPIVFSAQPVKLLSPHTNVQQSISLNDDTTSIASHPNNLGSLAKAVAGKSKKTSLPAPG